MLAAPAGRCCRSCRSIHPSRTAAMQWSIASVLKVQLHRPEETLGSRCDGSMVVSTAALHFPRDFRRVAVVLAERRTCEQISLRLWGFSCFFLFLDAIDTRRCTKFRITFKALQLTTLIQDQPPLVLTPWAATARRPCHNRSRSPPRIWLPN